MRIYKNDIINYKGVSNKHRSRQRRVAVFNNRFRLYVYSGRNIGC